MPLDHLMRAAFDASSSLMSPMMFITSLAIAVAIAIRIKRSIDANINNFRAESEKLKNGWANQEEEKPKRKHEEIDSPSSHFELGDDGELVEVMDEREPIERGTHEA